MATQSQINASLGLPPGINPDGSWNAQDYIARKVSGQPDTQAQVDAANAANPYSAQNMAKVDITRPGQYVQDEGGNYVALSPNVAGYDATNPTALTYLGELRARGGNDTTTQQFNATATPAQKAEADRLWSIEKARLEEIDRQAALAAQGQTSADQGKTMTSATKANPSALPAGFLESLTAIPNVTDQQIVTAMKTANVSPKNLADGLGIAEGEVAARVARTVPYGSTVQLGDTIVQPVYQVTGSGEDEQIGAIENVLTYRASDNKAGGGYTQYAADGTLERTGTQMKVNATKDFLKFAALAGAMFGGAALAGIGEGALTGTAAGTGVGAGTSGLLSGTAAGTVAGTTAGAATTLGGASTAGSLLGGSTLANSLLTSAGTGVVNKLLGGTSGSTNLSNLFSGGLGTAGNLLQMQQSREAAQKAQAMIDRETAAAKQAAAFTPFGVAGSAFGTAEFKKDAITGQLIGAGFKPTEGVLQAQNRLVALGNQGLAQAEAAQAQFAPLQAGATSLFNLGSKYLAKTPEDVAKDYLASQMSLLQPSRDVELANIETRLRNQGRLGLSVSQGTGLAPTTPELQALYNARARQDAELAANAQLAGQRDVLFGAGLYDLGAKSLGNYYSGQQASYAPYTTALGQFTNLEQLAQQPLTTGINLGQISSQAGANVGKLGLTGAQLSTNLATGADATRNLAAQGLIAAGNPNAMFGQALNKVAGGLFGNTPQGGLTTGFTPAQIAATEAGYPIDYSFYS